MESVTFFETIVEATYNHWDSYYGENVSEDEIIFRNYFLTKTTAVKYAQRHFSRQPVNDCCDSVLAIVFRVTITENGTEKSVAYRKYK